MSAEKPSPKSSPPKLSALVVARNEEKDIGACLATLAFADEIIVVLDRSTDRSAEIARGVATRVIEGAWEIEGPRRNTGIEACSGDWILEVDADERVSPALAAEIRSTIAAAPFGHFLIPYDNYVGNRLVRYGWGPGWGVSATVRLFSKGAKRWGDQRIHPSVVLLGEKMRLQQTMSHYVDRDISDMLQRLDRYTTARAADLRARGQIGSLPDNIRRCFSRFFKCYVGRKGYREKRFGFVIALMAGLYPLLSYLKAREAEEGKGDEH